MKLGILGAGQLALYMAQSGVCLGLDVAILASSPEEPACLESFEVFFESQTDDFLKEVDCLTFENEFFKNEYLEKILKFKTKCFPSIDCIELLKNKYSQKKLFTRLGIETVPYCRLDPASTCVEERYEVLKLSHSAYDGKGLFFVSSETSKSLTDFIHYAKKNSITIYAEEKMVFDKELAIQCSFESGDFVYSFPLVETIQKKGICKWVQPFFGEQKKELQAEALRMAQLIAGDLKYTGLLALEFFYQEKENRLLINELAPRVHNSAHYTLDAFNVSQFEAHLRAGCQGLSRPQLCHKTDVLMLNLISPLEKNLDAQLTPCLGMGKTYWYGKNKAKQGRKMGHCNLLLDGAGDLELLKKQMLEKEFNFWENLK